MGECKVNEFSSRVCEKGTKSCDVYHNKLKACPFCGGEALLSELSNELDSAFKITCIGEIDSSCAGLGLDSALAESSIFTDATLVSTGF